MRLFDTPLVWKVSAAWLNRPHQCTLAGILARCDGACCKTPAFWPSKAYEGNVCGNLGPQGCRLDPHRRPVTCLLYPLKVNGSGTLVLHQKATFPKGICKGNHGNGPRLIEALEDNLTTLFGAEQYARVRADLDAGRDSYFEVPPELAEAYADDHRRDAENLPVEPR